MAPSHEMVPTRLGFADVLGARTLGALPGLERHGLPLTERVERLARRLMEEGTSWPDSSATKPKPLSETIRLMVPLDDM